MVRIQKVVSHVSGSGAKGHLLGPEFPNSSDIVSTCHCHSGQSDDMCWELDGLEVFPGGFV